jgi:hypothetical protein
MVVQLTSSDRQEREASPAPVDRDEPAQIDMLYEAWEQGLLSDAEYRAAGDHLLRFGAPYLTESR